MDFNLNVFIDFNFRLQQYHFSLKEPPILGWLILTLAEAENGSVIICNRPKIKPQLLLLRQFGENLYKILHKDRLEMIRFSLCFTEPLPTILHVFSKILLLAKKGDVSSIFVYLYIYSVYSRFSKLCICFYIRGFYCLICPSASSRIALLSSKKN